ncbi:hypothetical protein LINGRAHAP2_LOCUS6109 [Linum grandiflorum]
MDRPPEELQSLSVPEILMQSISIPKQSPKTFYLITLTLIFPLSFAILAHSLFTHPIIAQLENTPDPDDDSDPTVARYEWTLLIFQFWYSIFLFAFSLLSTAAVVFTVASLYTAKPVSFSSTAAAIPRLFKRLFVTFVFVALLMFLYNAVFLIVLVVFVIVIDTSEQSPGAILSALLLVFAVFLAVHVYITALWHLASVVSVLEPVYGFAAMKKSYELLKGKTGAAFVMVFGYLIICGVVNTVFGSIVVHGGLDYGLATRFVVGGSLVGVLVVMNLVGLLVQSVYYYVCKSYHNQGIDKMALHDQLGEYLGEYVPLKSNIQLENLNVHT